MTEYIIGDLTEMLWLILYCHIHVYLASTACVIKQCWIVIRV